MAGYPAQFEGAIFSTNFLSKSGRNFGEDYTTFARNFWKSSTRRTANIPPSHWTKERLRFSDPFRDALIPPTSSLRRSKDNPIGISNGSSRKPSKRQSWKMSPFHTLRHTAVSHMVMSGVPLATVKEILRHKDFEMTLRYAHLSSEHTRAAMNAMGASLATTSKDKTKTA